MDVITRKQALERGLSKYYTGEPCKHGHLAQRYTTSGTCASCIAESSHSSRKQLNQAKAAQAVGLVHFEAQVRPQDVAMLRDLIAAWVASGPAIPLPPLPGAPVPLPPLDMAAERRRILGAAADLTAPASPNKSWADGDGEYRG